ncbi:MAG TPA: hypothetical protein GXZ96_06100 [Firmicutes bacterium]|jgi:hypothetical protein|nr:hypothetical protein [Bacillota bacterium]
MLFGQFLILLAFFLIAAYEVPGILQRQEQRDLVVFSALLLVGLVLSMLYQAGVVLPNPADWIHWMAEILGKPLGIVHR